MFKLAPDDFGKKIAQNVAQPMFSQNYFITCTVEKSSQKIWATCAIFKNNP
jgi:hypothetical protein